MGCHKVIITSFRMLNNLSRIILTTLLLTFFVGQGVVEADQSNNQLISTVSIPVLESKIKELESTTSLDEGKKEKLLELYRRALSNFETVHSYTAQAESFAQAQNDAPAEIKKLHDSLMAQEESIPEKVIIKLSKLSLPKLEERLQKEKANLAAVEAKLLDINNRLIIQNTRPNKI